MRSTSEVCYSSHYQAIYKSTGQVTGAVKRAFRLSVPELLWPAFTGNVLPKLIFDSAA